MRASATLQDRRRINQHRVEVVPESVEKADHACRMEQPRDIGAAGTARKERQPRDVSRPRQRFGRIVLARRGLPEEVAQTPGVRLIENRVESRPPQVGIDEQDALIDFGEGDRQIRDDRALSLLRRRAGDQDDLPIVSRIPRRQNRRERRPEGLCKDRRLSVPCRQLDAFDHRARATSPAGGSRTRHSAMLSTPSAWTAPASPAPRLRRG